MVRARFTEVYRGESPHRVDIIALGYAEKEPKEAKRAMRLQENNYVSPREWHKAKR